MGAFNFLRPFIAPILTPFIGSLIVWLNVKYHIIYTPDQVEKINQGAVTAILLIFSTAASLSAGIKVAINKKINKSNAATTALALHGNEQEKIAKAEQTGTFVAQPYDRAE